MFQQRHFFPGGNTCRGFVGFFDNLLPGMTRLVAVKGGPGVGKSTLMRRFGERLLAAGERVEFFHCSSDPDSLDAVAAPARGLLLLDGTAPHVIDPQIPGAQGSTLNLGVCLDERALARHAGEIAALTHDISGFFARAYQYLAAAHSVWRDASAIYAQALDPAALREVICGLCEAVAPGGAHSRTLYAEAVTPKGVIRHLDSMLEGEIVAIDAPFGLDADALLRPLAQTAALRGAGVREYRDPLDAARLAHLGVGGVTFTTCCPPGVTPRALPLDARVLKRHAAALTFDRAAYDLLLSQAIDALASAKALHDELEKYYVAHMDYARWDALLEEAWTRYGAPE